MRIPEPVYRAWTGMPFPYQSAIVVAVLVATFAAAGGASLAVSKWKDWRFDRAEAARAAERDKLTADRDAAIRRAEAAEAQASVHEAQLAAQKQLLAGAGKAIAAKDKQVEAIVDEYHREIDSVSGSGQSPAERAADVRRRLRELGYLRE